MYQRANNGGGGAVETEGGYVALPANTTKRIKMRSGYYNIIHSGYSAGTTRAYGYVDDGVLTKTYTMNNPTFTLSYDSTAEELVIVNGTTAFSVGYVAVNY